MQSYSGSLIKDHSLFTGSYWETHPPQSRVPKIIRYSSYIYIYTYLNIFFLPYSFVAGITIPKNLMYHRVPYIDFQRGNERSNSSDLKA